MVRVGGVRPPPFTVSTITYKVAVCTLQLREHLHSPYFSSTLICTLWSGGRYLFFSADLISLWFYDDTKMPKRGLEWRPPPTLPHTCALPWPETAFTKKHKPEVNLWIFNPRANLKPNILDFLL